MIKLTIEQLKKSLLNPTEVKRLTLGTNKSGQQVVCSCGSTQLFFTKKPYTLEIAAHCANCKRKL